MHILILYIDKYFEENLINKDQEKSNEKEFCTICLELYHQK